MRYFKSDFVYPVSSLPVRDGILVTDDAGVIADLIDPVRRKEEHDQVIRNMPELETRHGILCPGFINAHCHLELSHLKDRLTEKQKLPAFLRQVSTLRQVTEDEIFSAQETADAEMSAQGIVAVGDISNTDHSFLLKGKSKIRYFTFVEAFDFHPDRAFDVFGKTKELFLKLSGMGLDGSIVPHAPYTVSAKLLKLINDFVYDSGGPVSIHNQETASENAMFRERSGELFDFLNSATPFYQDWKPTGFASLASTLVHLPKCNKIQLVHNTFSQAEDINWAHLYSMLVWWCFCPGANLFIEDRLPDVPLFMSLAAKITIGTDSYASNWSLSVLDELKRIHLTYPQISLQDLLTWATLNGAEFLGYHRVLGSFEKGKKPGINLIHDMDTETSQLTSSSGVVALI